MTELPDERMVEGRKDLLPEEVAAGSEDPQTQAEVILEESMDRTLHPEATREAYEQTPSRDDS